MPQFIFCTKKQVYEKHEAQVGQEIFEKNSGRLNFKSILEKLILQDNSLCTLCSEESKVHENTSNTEFLI